MNNYPKTTVLCINHIYIFEWSTVIVINSAIILSCGLYINIYHVKGFCRVILNGKRMIALIFIVITFCRFCKVYISLWPKLYFVVKLITQFINHHYYYRSYCSGIWTNQGSVQSFWTLKVYSGKLFGFIENYWNKIYLNITELLTKFPILKGKLFLFSSMTAWLSVEHQIDILKNANFTLRK